MNFRKVLLAILLLLFSDFLSSQDLSDSNTGDPTASKDLIKLDSLRIERIAKISQLWGHIRYFHPYLDKNPERWNRAYTTGIIDVIKAGSKKEFRTAIRKMLLELNDPVTCIIEPHTASNEDTLKYPIISCSEDSILYVSIRNYNDLEDYPYTYNQLNSLKKKIPVSSGIIFDLRNKSNNNIKGRIEYYFQDLQLILADKRLYLTGYKSKHYDGFEPEIGNTTGGYSSGFYIKGEKEIIPDSNGFSKKVIFVCNNASELPRVALALQSIGQGFIISEDTLFDASLVHTAAFDVEDSINVQVRLDELAVESKPAADLIIAANTEEPEIIEIARQFFDGSNKPGKIIKKDSYTPNFEAEKITPVISANSYYPDLGNRLLAIAKIWTVISYFHAYKHLMNENWDEVLRKSIPRFVNASDSLEYHLAVAEMYKHIEDGHGFIRSMVLNNYFGTASPPVVIRFIENLPVVVEVLPDSVIKVEGIEKGDIIERIDGEDVESVIKRRMKYKCASNLSALYNYISGRLLNGPDSSTVFLTIRNRNQESKLIELPRSNAFKQYIYNLPYGGRQSFPILRLINEDIGYADLDRLTPDMVDKMFEEFKDTKAIIFDMRGYPNGTAWTIAPHLTNQKNVLAANFRRYSPMYMRIGSDVLETITVMDQELPRALLPFYKGITVMLIDERTQSQAEHTGLFFEAANHTKFIGSQSAGADGDITTFQIPGNIILYFSGHDVRHFDGRQLQKIGLVPDIQIKPTIEGIRNGKDEVLLRAIEYLSDVIND